MLLRMMPLVFTASMNVVARMLAGGEDFTNFLNHLWVEMVVWGPVNKLYGTIRADILFWDVVLVFPTSASL